MPQPSQAHSAATEPLFARSLMIGANLGHPAEHGPDEVPVRILLNDPARRAALSHSGLIAESGSELAFHRLRIVLESLQPGAAATDHGMPARADAGVLVASPPVVARQIEPAPGVAPEPAPDPVIAGLSDALAAAERAGDLHSSIYADAVRLAIVIRLLGQQPQPVPLNDEPVAPVPATRQVRALQKWRLKRVLEYIDEHLSSKISLGDLATVAGLSRMHFASQFRAATGLRPHEYLLRQRIHRAQDLLLGSAMTIVEVALTVGFQTQAHFTTVFKRFVGDTPCQWRNARDADAPACR